MIFSTSKSISKYILVLSKSFFLFILFFSCNQSKKKDITYFDKIVPIEGKLLIDGDQLQDPWAIGIVDSVIIVGNMKGIPLIETYNRFSGTFIKSFLELGQGPLEVLALDQPQIVQNSNYIYIYDLLGRKMIKIKKDGLMSKEKDVNIEPYFNLNNSNSNEEVIGKLSYYNDDLFIASLTTNKGRLGIFHKGNYEMDYYLPIRETLHKNISEYQNARMFSSDITISPDRKKMALSTHMADILDIYKFSGNKLDSVWHFQSFLPNNMKVMEFENTPTQVFYTSKSKLGYLDITSSKEKIYALFSGKCEEDGDHYYTNKIRVIDWEGKENYELYTNYMLKRIAVDENNRILYGIAKNNEGDPIIVSFNLDKVKNEF